MKTCCFIGHRKIEITDELVSSIRHILEKLIEDEGVRIFAFGSRSEFNDLCHEIVTDLQKEYNGLERVYLTCRSEACTLESEREKWEEIYSSVLKREIHLQSYEREIEHKTKYTSGKAAYVERNQALIDMSDFCMFYYDENYQPPMRKYSRRSLFPYQPQSGTALAYKYAKQKKKRIINMYGCEKF